MPLQAQLQQALAAKNFVTPTPVQIQAIPPALEGKDVIATAQTGTGKTLAFLIPIMEMLAATPAGKINALVLVPTRELAIQVHEQYEALRSPKATPAALVIGGLSEKVQIRALRAGARMVVATPGRLEDYMRRKIVDLRNVRILGLDEVDRMLDMGFLPAITRILATLPTERQTLCFSATLEKSVQGLLLKCTRNAVRIALGNVLRELLYNESGKTLIFARTKRGTERLAKDLMRDGFAASMIHGDRSQSQRSAALAGFEAGRFQVLVATDVAARGIHVGDVAHVVNYDLPSLAEDFIHRVGRTGRAGLTGRATTIVSGAEMIELRRFERTLKLRIERMDLGTVKTSDTRNVPVPINTGRHNTNTLKSRTLSSLPGEVFA